MEAETLVRPVIEDPASSWWTSRSGANRAGGCSASSSTVRAASTCDTIAELAEKVSRRLDVEGFAPGPYALEVSSPGIERSLKLPRDFARRVGDNVKVKTTTPIEGRTNITGELVSADDDGIAVAAAGGELRVRYADIASARTVVDWDAELKRSTR